jgi:4-methyl-5(b-hydroxyethyl)-thiazole monophosphate biosynthesis
MRVLCVVGDGFEEIEAVTPIDLLRRAQVEVVVAALGASRQVTGRSGISLVADTLLDEVAEQSFDLLLVPGGPGVAALRADGRCARLARTYVESGRPVAAICAAPMVLHDAGLLTGRRHTAHFSVHEQLPQADGDLRVAVDGDVITSRGAGTALDFGLLLVRRLCGDETANQVARSIMA